MPQLGLARAGKFQLELISSIHQDIILFGSKLMAKNAKKTLQKNPRPFQVTLEPLKQPKMTI